MDFISSSKNAGSSAFGSSSSSSTGNGSAIGGVFSNFFNLSIQKMVLILAIIAFIISIGTVAILLWKSKSTQKWPPEIAKCPDRMEYDSANNKCIDKYDLFQKSSGASYEWAPDANGNSCANFNTINGMGPNTKPAAYDAPDLVIVDGYVPWEGVIDGQKSRASSLKCP
jgi:preprotein translocase subunit SecG